MILTRIMVTFQDGTIEYGVRYTHADDPGSPGSKGRTTRAARLAAKGLEAALEGLSRDPGPLWGGFATNTRESTDTIMVEQKEQVS
jgi:hypothetical protein